MDKQGKPKNVLRPLGKPVYIFLFPVMLAGGWLFFRDYCEQYYQTEWPFWTLLPVFPLILLGIAAGYQTEIYLQKTIGKKAEAVIDLLLTAVLIWTLFAEYQYVLAPQGGLPPLTWGALWEGVKRLVCFWK